ncbi:MAG: type III-B CRISPR module-associated protein Cmr3 [Pseudohongiella sp.]|nr:type III-B CRISPR module-associated protein Cmr3 [Pseudohongiella sp.]
MSQTEYRYIEPLDVLFLRGNKLFGDPGSYGESLIPPWPSVAAGAIRSRMLADDGVDLSAFAAGNSPHATLGTPAQPGSFMLQGFSMARNVSGQVEVLMAPPSDLVISKDDQDKLQVSRLVPQLIDLPSSFALPMLPVLAQSERKKAVSGFWLTQAGWQAYLSGQNPTAAQLIPSFDLWGMDPRIGIGMNESTGSVEDGKLFSAQAVVLKRDVGFLAAVTGAAPPVDGLLRLGGDGRAASIIEIKVHMPEPDYVAIATSKRCCVVLTSPGLFPDGWKLTGIDTDNRFNLGGISARLVSACVPRAETISGWDLARREPKPAQRVAPTGSVYWLDDLKATPEQLRKLAENGLWPEPCEDASRRAEGFNRCAIGVWI